MKKLVCAMLALAMLLSGVCAMAESEGSFPYDVSEPVTFSVTTSQTMTAKNYNAGNLYDYMAEKFNITLDVKAVPYGDQDSKTRTNMTAGTLPDTVCWLSFNAIEYQTFVEAGTIAPLPEGWEEKYPNMHAMMQSTGIYDQLVIDGRVYAVPHATFYTFNRDGVSENGVVPHALVYYRKDWAREVGMDIDESITREELREYLTRCVEQDMAKNGKTFGLSCDPGSMIGAYMAFTDCQWSTFPRTDDGYTYGLLADGVTEIISELRALYQDGLIYPDFYNITDGDHMFTTGMAAAKIDAGVVNTLNWSVRELVSTYEGMGIEFDRADMGVAVLCDEDGNYHQSYGTNYWTASIFNPEIDAVKMDRILSIIDWLCTEEGERICQMGIPEVDWTVDENGEYVSLMAPNPDGTPKNMWQNSESYCVWRQLGVLSDDFQIINPSLPKDLRELCAKMYAYKNSHNEKMVKVDLDYRFYNSEAKAILSVPYSNEIARMMMAPNVEVEAEWATFVENYRNLWEPVLNELNAEFFGK